jgi:membrane protein DedA with SNARE-associated domain
VSFEAGFMKNPIFRYYTMEHITMMLAAVVLVTIGIARVKRLPENKKHRSVWAFELIALVLISAALLTLK